MSETIPKRGFPPRFDNSVDKTQTEFDLNDSGRGLVLRVRTANGDTKSTMFPLLDGASPLAQMTSYAGECARAFVNDYDNAVKNFIGDELIARVRGAFVARFSKTCAETQRAGRKEAQDVAASHVALMAVDPASSANSHLRAAAMVKWNAANQAGREAIALNENTAYEETAALIETGALSSVSDRAREAAERRYMSQRWIIKSGSQSQHEIQPSYESPLACGPDRKAAQIAAMLEIDKLTERSDAVTSVSDMLRGLVDVMSAATGMSPHDTYRTLIGNKAA